MKLLRFFLAEVVITQLLLCGAANAEMTSTAYLVNLAKKTGVSVIKIYRTSGISGLKGESMKCFESVKGDQLRCAMLDIGANYLDDGMAKTNNFPADEYFEVDAMLARVYSALGQDGLSKDQSLGLVKFCAPFVIDGISSEMGRSKDALNKLQK